MKTRVLLSCTLLFLACSFAFCQESEERPALELPDTDIFLFDFAESAEKITVANRRNVTNRSGYDNQPWFTPKSMSLLFSSGVVPDRTDIYEYLIETGEIRQVTNTPDQEYSPQSSPDNETISYVTDGETANQSIWFTKRGSSSQQWLLRSQGQREPVGYYSWNRATGYILYWSRYGFSLRLVHETKKHSHYVTGDALPASPHIIPGTNRFSFLHRQGNEEIWIKELDPETLSVRPLSKTLESNGNYGWTPKGWIIMADGTKLHRCRPAPESQWELIADLADFDLREATRVAVSPDGRKLAVVGKLANE